MWLHQFESLSPMAYVIFALVSLVVLLQVALGRRARSFIRRAYDTIPIVGNETFNLNVGRALPYVISVLSMCLVGTLLSGVGDAALARGTAQVVFAGANPIATLIICQTRMEYFHKVKTVQLLLIVDLIDIAALELQWAFGGSASVILLLGAWILVAIAILVGVYDSGSHGLLVEILTSVVGMMFWIVSMQVPPLLGDQQGYIQSTLLATILAIRLRKTPMHALIMLSWCLYCMWSFILGTVGLPMFTSVILRNNTKILQKRTTFGQSSAMMIGCAVFSAIVAYVIYRLQRRDNNRDSRRNNGNAGTRMDSLRSAEEGIGYMSEGGFPLASVSPEVMTLSGDDRASREERQGTSRLQNLSSEAADDSQARLSHHENFEVVLDEHNPNLEVPSIQGSVEVTGPVQKQQEKAEKALIPALTNPKQEEEGSRTPAYSQSVPQSEGNSSPIVAPEKVLVPDSHGLLEMNFTAEDSRAQSYSGSIADTEGSLGSITRPEDVHMAS